MKKKKLIVSLLFFISVTTVFIGSYQELSEPILFAERVEGVLRESGVSGALCSVYVESVSDGVRLLGCGDDKLLSPASCMKLWTTATALEMLTPEHRFKTSVYAMTPNSSGVVKGDIVLYGRGDPTLDTEAINRLAKQLYYFGVRKIKGNIVASDSYLNTKKLQEKWEVFDTDWYYAPEITALCVNENALRLTVDPGEEVGGLARVNLEQEVPYCFLNNFISTVDGDGVEVDVVRKGNIFTLYGAISSGGQQVVERIATPNVPRYAGLVLQKKLADLGIAHKGEVVVEKIEPLGLVELASVSSKSLGEIVRATNKISNNLYAELLLNAVGKKFAQEGENTAKKGVEEVMKLATRIGINPKDIKFDDGCGLSHCNLMSSKQMVQLLSYMDSSSHRQIFYDSLPIAGEDGRSFKGRFLGTLGEGNIHAKTGMQSYISSLSGYAKSRKGKEVAFSVMLNNSILSATDNRKLVDDIVLSALEMC